MSLSIVYIYLIKCLPQDLPLCSLKDHSCYNKLSTEQFDCRKSCTGIYADITRVNDKDIEQLGEKTEEMEKYLTDIYISWKINLTKTFGQSLVFDSENPEYYGMPHCIP